MAILRKLDLISVDFLVNVNLHAAARVFASVARSKPFFSKVLRVLTIIKLLQN